MDSMYKFYQLLTSSDYSKAIVTYNKRDCLYAMYLYIISFAIATTFVLVRRIFGFTFVIFIPSMFLIILLVFVFVRIRKESAISIGITKSNLTKSAIMGIVVGAVVLFFLDRGMRIRELFLDSSTANILFSFFFWFAMVSLSEELLFRGYIQPRLNGIAKSEILAVLLGSIMFALMHVPTVAVDHLMGISTFEFSLAHIRWLAMLMGFHVLFHILYRKYNSIVAPFIVHGFVNLGLILPVLFV